MLMCVVKWWRLKLGNNFRRVLRLGKFLDLDKTRDRAWINPQTYKGPGVGVDATPHEVFFQFFPRG